MPTIPNTTNLNGSSVDILNAIRNSATANYRNYIPAATESLDSIREIGAVIMQFPALQNEFLTALVNRIGRVMITSKMFDNPWRAFKKGMLEFGETIEEIFVNIASPFNYDPETAENQVFKRNIPDVRAAFHILNYQKFYKATIQNDTLRQAFLSWDGITDLIAKIVDSMYTGANYDEFVTMKYLLARHILNGELYPVQVSETTAANMKTNVATIKGVSNAMVFPSTKYNLAGVTTKSEKTEQYIITNAEFDAVMDVEVLAAAFNMDKAEFMGCASVGWARTSPSVSPTVTTTPSPSVSTSRLVTCKGKPVRKDSPGRSAKASTAQPPLASGFPRRNSSATRHQRENCLAYSASTSNLTSRQRKTVNKVVRDGRCRKGAPPTCSIASTRSSPTSHSSSP